VWEFKNVLRIVGLQYFCLFAAEGVGHDGCSTDFHLETHQLYSAFLEPLRPDKLFA